MSGFRLVVDLLGAVEDVILEGGGVLALAMKRLDTMYKFEVKNVANSI